MPEFAATDVWAVARALIEGSEYVDDKGRCAYTCCNHCSASESYDFGSNAVNRPLVHEAHCPVLMARDLLTGAPKDG